MTDTQSEMRAQKETCRKAKLHRQEIISINCSRRMQAVKKPPLPVPEMPKEPITFEVLDCEGNYLGVVLAYSKVQALSEAQDIIEQAVRVRVWR